MYKYSRQESLDVEMSSIRADSTEQSGVMNPELSGAGPEMHSLQSSEEDSVCKRLRCLGLE